MLAASTLTNLVSRNTTTLSIDDRISLSKTLFEAFVYYIVFARFEVMTIILGTFTFQYLQSHLDLPDFVSQALVQLLARITKHGWFDVDEDKIFKFRNFFKEVDVLLQVSIYMHIHLLTSFNSYFLTL